MTYEYKEDIENVIIGSNEYLEDAAFDELNNVYKKARAFDHIKVIYKKNMEDMSINDDECIEMIGNELERADDER